jgi:hypothetical protein
MLSVIMLNDIILSVVAPNKIQNIYDLLISEPTLVYNELHTYFGLRSLAHTLLCQP